jgi:predicted RNA binding protein YcfA (HicA-like mRNA interferase family)
MKLPRDLAGVTLADCLCRRWNYRKVHQEGSHIVIETSDPSQQRIAIPAHSSLRIGTLNAILRAVCRHKGVTRQQVLDTL